MLENPSHCLLACRPLAVRANSAAAGTAGGYWTLFSPVLMTVLLLRVSGVALLEQTQIETKPQYRDYIESTSAFFPWFPRRQG